MANLNAVVTVHWPGKSTAMCRRHADYARQVALAMGLTQVTETACDPCECKNCTNEVIVNERH